LQFCSFVVLQFCNWNWFLQTEFLRDWVLQQIPVVSMSDPRGFVSRLYLKICSNRDDVMLGAAKDFWRLHPEVTDTDTLLTAATDKLEVLMSSSGKLLQLHQMFREIIRTYIHDMFPYYLYEHVDEIEAFVRSGCSLRSHTPDIYPHHTTAESALVMSPTRPPRPTSFTDSPESSSESSSSLVEPCTKFDDSPLRSIPCTQFVSSMGTLYKSDTEGVIRWCDASRFGVTERWSLVRESISLVPHSRTKGVYTATALIREKVWIASDGTGVLELWPGFPRHRDVRAIDVESFSSDCLLKVSPEPEARPGQAPRRLLDVLGNHRVALEFCGHPPGKVVEVEYKRVFVMYALW